MAKVLIIGSGPAGVSAALYARRGGADVTVISKGSGALGKAEKIENYYGLEEPITGRELERRGIAGAMRLGVEFVTDEVMGLGFREDMKGFRAICGERVYEADCVILAAGASRKSPSLPGLRELEGHGVSYCAVCDAFFYRGKRAAVLGAGEYAMHEAQVLLPHAAKVLLLTDGAAPEADVPEGVEVHEAKLQAILGESRVEAVKCADGEEIAVDGIFVAIGTAGSTELARKMGLLLEGNAVHIEEDGSTNIPGVFAAGDCTGGQLQIAKAVYQGAAAGLAAVKYLREKA
ncbi:MAG: FAD-dependent oxidoreductase [Selenomonadaceae bacterium]|nr:FAD-dependent oxidoreductase [Selenomonadaceae bacterium]